MNDHQVAGPRRWGRMLAQLALVLPLGAAGLGAQALATAPVAQAAPTTATFTYTGGEQTYTVPPGVTAVTVTAVGAPGGTGEVPGADVAPPTGGTGASVTATVPLPTGATTLYVEVGGAGHGYALNDLCAPGVHSAFNGGGGSICGGTGGGASDVRTVSCGSPCNTSDPASLSSRLVVAGGGGGGGGCSGPGGTAGDSSVTGPGNGGASNYCRSSGPGGNGGFGGTAGGAGGAGGSAFCYGGSGSLGQGGDTANAYDDPQACLGGGGGGGYYGGGAGGTDLDNGGAGGGGGAGSSFWISGATGASMSEDTTGVPQVQITPAAITAPAVTGVSPASGPLAGGTTVTITGTGFTGASAVDFGSMAASSYTVNGDTSISATAPAAASAGTVDVTVTTPAGTSATSAADQYSYLYSFTGFLAPVANPPVVNMVHAGQSIPIQFQLGGDFGPGILAAGYPTAQQVSCATGVPDNTTTATDTAGASGLQYDATTGTYTYVWKTSKASRGTCQVFTLGLNDGTFHTAIFEYIN